MNKIELATLEKNIHTVNRLRKECESAKERLSDNNLKQIDIYVDALFNGIDLKVRIRKDKFNELNEELFTKTLKIVELALNLAKLQSNQIDSIILAGGSTRIPKLRAILRAYFDGMELIHSINADEAGKLLKSRIYFLNP